MSMQTVQLVPRDGLGLPIVPIVMAGGSALFTLFNRPKCPAKMSADDAKSIVKQIFLELLEREPDYPGAQGYVDGLLLRNKADCENKPLETPGQFSPDDVRTMVLSSQEYRDLQARKAAAVYGEPGGPGASPAASGYTSDGGGISTMSVAGIPVVYLGAGLLLLMLMKR